MATRTLSENINQAISDFKGIKQAIIDKGVEIPSGTKTIEYVAKIGEIQGGGTEVDLSTITDFSYLFVNGRFTNMLENISSLDTQNGTNFKSMFDSCYSLTKIPALNTSNGTNFYGMFYSCNKIESLPVLDTAKGTEFILMFANCRKLKSIQQLNVEKTKSLRQTFVSCENLEYLPPLNTTNVTDFYYTFSRCQKLKTIEITNYVSSSATFSNCKALENLIITGYAKVSNNDLYLSSCVNLTVESMVNLFEKLTTNTSSTKYKITLGSTNLAKLTAEQKQIAIDKNYTLA